MSLCGKARLELALGCLRSEVDPEGAARHLTAALTAFLLCGLVAEAGECAQRLIGITRVPGSLRVLQFPTGARAGGGGQAEGVEIGEDILGVNYYSVVLGVEIAESSGEGSFYRSRSIERGRPVLPGTPLVLAGPRVLALVHVIINHWFQSLESALHLGRAAGSGKKRAVALTARLNQKAVLAEIKSFYETLQFRLVSGESAKKRIPREQVLGVVERLLAAIRVLTRKQNDPGLRQLRQMVLQLRDLLRTESDDASPPGSQNREDE